MLKYAPALAITLLVGPIIFGLAATLLPAFGYLPPLGGHEFSLEAFSELFARPALAKSMLISLICGLFSSAIALLSVAIYVAGWSRTVTFQKMQHFVSPLLSLPHAAAAFGLAFLIAPSGWIMRIVSPHLSGFERPPDVLILHDEWGLAMVAGLVVKEIPFILLVTLAALPQTNARNNSHIASALGYGRIAGFIHVVWPQIYKQIRLPVFAVIAYSSSVVDVAIILGPDSPAPLSPRLIGWMNDPDLSMRFEASAGAVIQLFVTLGALLIWRVGEFVFGTIRRFFCRRGNRFSNDSYLRIVAISWLGLGVATVILGMIILAIWSFAGFWSFPDALPDSFTTRNWQRSLPALGLPLLNSLLIGAAATIIAIIITLACLEQEGRSGKLRGETEKRAMFLIYLPLLIPQTGFVFGLQLFFLLIGLDATLAALIAVHFIFVFPYVFLSLSAPWRAWDIRYRNVAYGLGVNDNTIFWKIRLPMLLRAVLIASAVGFAVSIGQYLPTILIGAGRLPTITTEAVSLASGGDRRIIGVYAFLQMVLPFAGFALATLIPAYMFRNRIDLKAA